MSTLDFARLAELVRAEFDPQTVDVPGYQPQPKQQTAQQLADSDVFELLYGGAAGGGKSYWIRFDAVRFCLNHPGAHVGIVRRTMPMLKQTHLGPLRDICRDLADHNRTESTWTFPNGATLRLISLQHDGDEQNYKSVEFDRLYFDEVTELLESQYTYMLSRLRSTHGHPVTAIAVSNPEGVGYAWVKRRFVKPRPGDLAAGQEQPQPLVPWRPPLPDGSGPGRPRVFVPATILDNPALLAANPDYEMQLRSIPDARKRKALLEGDWDAMDQVAGALWSLTQIDADRVQRTPELIRTLVSVDPAITSGPNSDETGIIALGKAMLPVPKTNARKAEAHYYVLKDASCRRPADEWIPLVITLAIDLDADILVEVDQGGDSWRKMFRDAAREMGVTCPRVIDVHAKGKGSKAVRATPVAALYAGHRVHHVGTFDLLEEQQTTWVPELSKDSPDRIDALVHGVRRLDAATANAPVKARSLW